MKKILLLLDSAPIHPRLDKIGSIFKDCEVKSIMWDRSNFYLGKEPQNDNYIFKSEIGYGNKLKILKELPLFMHYIKKVLKEYKPDIIVARYFLVALLVTLVAPKNIELYYDVCDMPLYSSKLLNKVLKFLEKAILKRSIKIILGSRFFEEFYIEYKDKLVIIENKIDIDSFKNFEQIYSKVNNEKLVINYIGKIRYFDILKNIFVACKDLDIILNFYGDGSDLEKCKTYVQENQIKNVNFKGRFDYNNIQQYYKEADCILSTYPSKDVNVQYAIPNKFYEALYFDKPIIVSKDTKLGELVQKDGLGVVIDSNNVTEIRNEFSKLIENRELLDKICCNINKFKEIESVLWDKAFNF